MYICLKWGGISSVEHDEAVMLEAAMFGGIPEGTGFHFPYAPHQNGLDRGLGSYTGRIPRPPSPNLTAQRLIREQQVFLLLSACLELQLEIENMYMMVLNAG